MDEGRGGFEAETAAWSTGEPGSGRSAGARVIAATTSAATTSSAAPTPAVTTASDATTTSGEAAGPAATNARRVMRAALGDRIAEQAYHLDAAMHRLLTDVRQFDEAGYWADEGAASCAAWLSWRVGWTPGTGREHVRVARALAALPQIDDALRVGRLSYSKVRAITRVATAATEAALLVDALATTAAQLETICRKLRAVHRLAALAPDDVRARRAVTRRDRDDGMVVIEAVLPADEAALVLAAIEREAARASASDGVAAGGTGVPAETRRPVHLDRADGLVAMSQAALRGDAPGRSPVELVLTISRDALATRMGDGTVPTLSAAATDPAATDPAVTDAAVTDAAVTHAAMTEPAVTEPAVTEPAVTEPAVTHAAVTGPAVTGPAVTDPAVTHAGAASSRDSTVVDVGWLDDGACVSAETARRLSCDCGVVEVRQDAAGNTLSVGRRTRTIPAALARALARRDPTCRFPGCTSRRFLDGHHLVHWAHGGETSLTNTCRLCTRHHSFVHEHGYRLEWLDGDLAFFHRGARVFGEPPRVVGSSLGWATIRAAHAALDIDGRTGACGWNGQPVQYEWVVDGLVGLDRQRPTTTDT